MKKSNNEILDKDKNYKNAKSSKTTKSILNYQKTNDNKNTEKINNDIHEHGVILPKGQELFHGGLPGKEIGETFKSSGIFSTSLNPCVAINNAQNNKKVYDANELNLNCIKIDDWNEPNTIDTYLFRLLNIFEYKFKLLPTKTFARNAILVSI